MSADELLSSDEALNRLASLVFDEHRHISYKWAATELQISAQQSKQLLKQLAAQHEDRVEVTHLVSGRLKPQSNQSEAKAQHCVLLCSQSQLEATLAKFDPILSQHIYSIQPAAKQPSHSASSPPNATKANSDSNELLYSADLSQALSLYASVSSGEKSSSSLHDNSHSAIQNPNVFRTKNQLPQQRVAIDVEPVRQTATKQVAAHLGFNSKPQSKPASLQSKAGPAAQPAGKTASVTDSTVQTNAPAKSKETATLVITDQNKTTDKPATSTSNIAKSSIPNTAATATSRAAAALKNMFGAQQAAADKKQPAASDSTNSNNASTKKPNSLKGFFERGNQAAKAKAEEKSASAVQVDSQHFDAEEDDDELTLKQEDANDAIAQLLADDDENYGSVEPAEEDVPLKQETSAPSSQTASTKKPTAASRKKATSAATSAGKRKSTTAASKAKPKPKRAKKSEEDKLAEKMMKDKAASKQGQDDPFSSENEADDAKQQAEPLDSGDEQLDEEVLAPDADDEPAVFDPHAHLGRVQRLSESEMPAVPKASGALDKFVQSNSLSLAAQEAEKAARHPKKIVKKEFIDANGYFVCTEVEVEEILDGVEDEVIQPKPAAATAVAKPAAQPAAAPKPSSAAQTKAKADVDDDKENHQTKAAAAAAVAAKKSNFFAPVAQPAANTASNADVSKSTPVDDSAQPHSKKRRRVIEDDDEEQDANKQTDNETEADAKAPKAKATEAKPKPAPKAAAAPAKAPKNSASAGAKRKAKVSPANSPAESKGSPNQAKQAKTSRKSSPNQTKAQKAVANTASISSFFSRKP